MNDAMKGCWKLPIHLILKCREFKKNLSNFFLKKRDTEDN